MVTLALVRQNISMFLVALFMLLLLGSMHDAVQAQRTVVYTRAISDARMPLYQAFFDAFEDKTGIRVAFQQAPGNQIEKWEQVITRVAGGVSPDVVGGVSLEFVPYAALGLIEPLDAHIKASGADLSVTIPTLVEAHKWRGQQYLMPFGASGVILTYNPDLYDASGLQMPPDAWGDPDWTWEAFVSQMEKLTRKESDGSISQFGLAGPYWDSWITLPYNWGGDWIDPATNKFLGEHDNTLASLQALQDLRWTHHVMPQPGEGGGGISGLVAGTTAMGGFGTWNIQTLVDSGLPLRWTPWFQVGSNPLRGVVNPNGFAMLSTAPNQAEAWELIRFATLDPEGNFLYSLAAGSMPAVFETHADWVWDLEYQAPNLNPMAFVEQVALYPALINIRKTTTFPEINTIMIGAINDVYNNTKPPRQAMNEVAANVQRLIDESDH